MIRPVDAGTVDLYPEPLELSPSRGTGATRARHRRYGVRLPEARNP
jgi:hypothetical protein